MKGKAGRVYKLTKKGKKYLEIMNEAIEKIAKWKAESEKQSGGKQE